MKNIYLVIGFLLFVTLSCSSPKVHKSGIDPQIQEVATSVLQEQLPKAEADSGLILVMDVKSGQIKAKTSFKSWNGSEFIPGDEKMFTVSNELGSIFLPIAMMAALETGKISMNDSVDTGRGIYEYRGTKILDANYAHGGFGTISREQVIVVSSNIGVIRTIEDAFGDSIQQLPVQLKRMSLGEPFPKEYLKNKFLWNQFLAIGYEIKLSPLQIITFYNAIANNGKMVFEDQVLNAQIASEPNIKAMQKALARFISHRGPGFASDSDQISVAGKTGWTRFQSGGPADTIVNRVDVASFCGYFPVENPQYTCLVVIYNNLYSISMKKTVAVNIFKELVSKMVEQKKAE